MPSLVRKEERNLRIAKKLNLIQDLYKLAFSASKIVSMKTYQGDFVLSINEKDLTTKAKQLAKQIKEIKKNSVDVQQRELADRLTQVHTELVNVIRDEFKTLRTRNNRISTIED